MPPIVSFYNRYTSITLTLQAKNQVNTWKDALWITLNVYKRKLHLTASS